MSQTPFRQCQTTGCITRAQYAPKICVPAKGYAVELNKHVSVIVGLTLCEDHMVTLEPGSLLNRHLVAIIDGFCRGKVPPDYARAFILPVMLDSNEYRMWERERAKGKTQ